MFKGRNSSPMRKTTKLLKIFTVYYAFQMEERLCSKRKPVISRCMKHLNMIIPSAETMTDGITKPLPWAMFKAFGAKLGLRVSSSESSSQFGKQ